MRTRKEVIDDIIGYFEDDNELFNDCIEDLDSYNGYLDDDRYFPMDDFNDRLYGNKPRDIAYQMFFGYDEDVYSTDASGRVEYGKFNPNRVWFKWDGYGNLVSTNVKDYTGKLDRYFVESLADNRNRLTSIDYEPRLVALFDEYDECEE